ncbi:hypothetical protein K505DRAFT_327617 [Melanomma pulvis-pyrius CBS 109.77]|uniref:Uncharacterized protein n=1 Tax=Melanomma pulvis-pyrius CBS 109.77 TaxID=1314802 RepID=A0A6A6X1Z8_9PLEO|nr:hypothetical protein K505DRAFT_327617 [Melanomma pulvis-pyrius CBS 109.77]
MPIQRLTSPSFVSQSHSGINLHPPKPVLAPPNLNRTTSPLSNPIPSSIAEPKHKSQHPAIPTEKNAPQPEEEKAGE